MAGHAPSPETSGNPKNTVETARQTSASPETAGALDASWFAVSPLSHELSRQELTAALERHTAHLTAQLTKITDRLEAATAAIDATQRRLHAIEGVNKELLRALRQNSILTRAQLPLPRTTSDESSRKLNMALRQHVPIPFVPAASVADVT